MISNDPSKLQDNLGKNFVGLITSSGVPSAGADAPTSLKNNLPWLVFLTIFVVGFGLLVAVLVDKVRYAVVRQSVIFVH
jgi:alpha-glucoside transport system permease protein